MIDEYVLAIDQGTTGTTAMIIAPKKKNHEFICARYTVEFQQYYPKASWVEHDLSEIWNSIEVAVKNTIEIAQKQIPTFKSNQISCIGITNQRETTCFFNRKTLVPLRKAIVWQCKRSLSICHDLSQSEEVNSEIKTKTGLILDPYFSGSKISWVLDHDKHTSNELNNGNGAIGTIDSFIVAKLTNGEKFVTEASNASRTLLYNINTHSWDEDLLKLFKIPHQSLLPEVQDSVGFFGKTKGLNFLPDGIPITGILGDQQAALAGQACFSPGEAKCTYGTGAFLLLQHGETLPVTKKGLLTTVSWSLNGKLSYAYEGSAFIAGAAIQFLRDNLKFISKANESEKLALDINAAPNIYFVPSLSGLGAPTWNPKAKGAFLGLTRGTSIKQLVRAALEGICFQVNDLLSTMDHEGAEKLNVLRVDGGASENNLLLQMQSNFSNILVERPKYLETTAIGAAHFAALGVGLFTSLDELKNNIMIEKTFTPEVSFESKRDKYLQGWQKSIEAIEIFSTL